MKIVGNMIEANEGFILTDGNVYATKIRLGNWDKAENYREITKEEYEAIIAELENSELI